MPLFACPECGRSISDKAKSCPNCGLPLATQTLARRLAHSGRVAANAISGSLNHPATPVDVAQLAKELTEIPPDFSAGWRINGTGTSTGGYTGIPGLPGHGVVRKHFCVLFIPLIPLGLYLVKDWDGNGGVFLGKISSRSAAKYVNLSRQFVFMIIGGIATLIAVFGILYLVALAFGRVK
ncbi:MAG: zinc-ribbon domain-containing protein [Phycisphaerales bacterium]|nr:zinc-ribbon domain-containing protein [Phycisphaerales bacterium]